MRVAAIDVGTNTALLLIAEVGPDGEMDIVQEEERFVRLGEGVDGDRLIRPGALDRLRRALEAYALLIDDASVEVVDVVGTSASRDATNTFELDHLVRETVGVPFRVITGDEEARLTCGGAIGLLPGAEERYVVVDVGGGSTEVALADAGQRPLLIQRRLSVDLGGVRLTERFFPSMPPAGSAISRARQSVQKALEEVGLEPLLDHRLIGTSGTARSLAMIAAGIGGWEEANGATLSLTAEDIDVWSRRLLSMNTHEVLSLNPRLLGGRADILPAGVLILQEVMRALGHTECTVSRGGLKEGVALELVRNNH